MTEKKFINGIFLDEYIFPDGGKRLTVTFTDKFNEFYETNKAQNSKGNNQMKMDIKWSRDGKMYAELNTFVPKAQAPVVEEEDNFDDEIPW